MKPTTLAFSLSLILAACGGDEPPRQQATEETQGDRSFHLLGDFAVPERRYHFETGGKGDVLADMDGDGALDLVITGTGGSVFGDEDQRYFEVHRNVGTGFGPAERWLVPPEVDRYTFSAQDNGQCHGTWRWRLDDFDGDGLPDLLVTGISKSGCFIEFFGTEAQPSWLLYRNLGHGFSPDPEEIRLPADLVTHAELLAHDRLYGYLDMNRDGVRDIVMTLSISTGDVFGHGEPPHWLVFLVDGLEVLPGIEWSVPEGGTKCGYHLLEADRQTSSYCFGEQAPSWRVRDFDGDGLPDLLVVDPIRRGWFLHRGTPTGFGEPIEWQVPDRYKWATQSLAPEAGLAILDLDGDGKLDLIDTFGVYDHHFPSWRVYRGGEAGFQGSAEFYGVPESVSNRGTDAMSWNPCIGGFDCEIPKQSWITVDLNGDGRPELIVWDLEQPASTWQVWSLD